MEAAGVTPDMASLDTLRPLDPTDQGSPRQLAKRSKTHEGEGFGGSVDMIIEDQTSSRARPADDSGCALAAETPHPQKPTRHNHG
ncbi:unnamed protein product [Linum trigynum]|uniref:Uncharacterized protein n=1 Tax=Linum trigynum TaxID=586398 RepID=A0AAV2G885_9ROSI